MHITASNHGKWERHAKRITDGITQHVRAAEARGGGCSRTRTYGPLIKSQLLYQLSYAPVALVGEAAQ